MMEEKFELHRRILDDMHDLYVRKNTDYGDSTHETYLKFGTSAYLVRMFDKLHRLYAITNSGQSRVGTESVHDTLIDLANYAILMSMELRMENSNMVSSEVSYRG